MLYFLAEFIDSMVSPLEWLATVSQPFIVALLGLVSWYLKRGYATMQEIKSDNRFFHKALKGDDRLAYPGLIKRTNKMKQNQNTIARNQRQMYQSLNEYGVVKEDIDPPEEVNGPNPSVDDLDYGN